ncbi:zinc-ribbon domain-containing protein [Prevotella sp. P4-119]|uniref:zinc-ribbon domain-containing protein n=1 Tax=Prevotella sp. P4-119 TaxID=2024218 RepID=UPI000B964F93|nr:zinc-ribbon domain-containing protein [Prevotella sp. P4-119]OYP42989.1 hypothetical protein CIK89_10640 [Prevotella sp. P4-119]
MNCKSCGTSNPDEAKFCRRCGKKLNEDSNGGCAKAFLWIFLLGCILGGVAIYINNQNSQSSYTPTPLVSDKTLIDASDDQTKASYLNISDDDVRLSSKGESETITIDTDGEWKIGTEVEKWVSLTKDGNSLTIRVEKNKGKERTDYFTVVADDIEKRVDITQYASTDPYGEIVKVWVDHSTYDDDGTKGMRIHIAFKAHNMLNKEGRVSAYFYYSDGTALTDTNGSYKTTDGDVAVGKDFCPSYENSDFRDFKLFMPYSELHLDSSADIYINVSLWYNHEKISEDSEKEYMKYTTN